MQKKVSMPITATQNLLLQNLFSNSYILGLAKAAILIILVFYAIFSLIIVRQVDSMGKTLITSISPIVKALSIIHSGFAIGLIILAWGIL